MMHDAAHDRRTEPRHDAFIPAYIESPNDHERLALLRDVSTSGAFVLTRKRLNPGEPVRLRVPNEEADALVVARVVRSERRDHRSNDVWLHGAGLQFEPTSAG